MNVYDTEAVAVVDSGSVAVSLIAWFRPWKLESLVEMSISNVVPYRLLTNAGVPATTASQTPVTWS